MMVTARAQTLPEPPIEVIAGHRAAASRVLFKPSAALRDVDRAALRGSEDADTLQGVGGAGWFLIHSRSKSAVELLADLRGRAGIAKVEPDWMIHAASEPVPPNDPGYPQEWWLGTADAGSIGAPAAWATTTGSPDVVIGDLDTGADLTHPDLVGNLWTAPRSYTVNIGGTNFTCPQGSHGWDATGQTCSPTDEDSHGTATAGIMGAVGNNGIGVTGVNYSTQLVILRTMLVRTANTDAGGFISDAINAIEFAVQLRQSQGVNIRVLNASWYSRENDSGLKDEIVRAGSFDIFLVVAATDSCASIDQYPVYPAAWSTQLGNVIAVAADDENGNLSHWGSECSSWGPQSVQLAAPGSDGYTTQPGGAYGYFAGTSMATPMVAGGAALILSACPMPNAALRATILNNVRGMAGLGSYVSTGGALAVDQAIHACTTGTRATGSFTVGSNGKYGYPNDQGVVTLSVDGYQYAAASYDAQTDTAASIAGYLATAINGNPDSPVGAVASGATVTLTARTASYLGDYSFAANLQSYVCPNGPGSCQCDPNVDPNCPNQDAEFYVTQSGPSLTGGSY